MTLKTEETFRLAEDLFLRFADDAQLIEMGEDNDYLRHVTPITAELLRWWFQEDYRVMRKANFHSGQRDAILAIVYAHEVLGVTSLQDLYEKVSPNLLLRDGLLGEVTNERHRHPKYAAKMATGTGKTWVLNALLIWQHLNSRASPGDERFSSNFLIVAPGLIVYDRLLDSFQGRLRHGIRDFETSDIYSQRQLFVPPTHEAALFNFLQSSVVTKKEIGHKVTGGGMVAITNWHLLAGVEDPDFVEEDDIEAPGEDIDARRAISSFFPLTPGTAAGNSLDTLDRRHLRGGPLQSLVDLPDLVVFNDEAHHIHSLKKGEVGSDVEWQKSLSAIAESKARRFVQFDFSATPYNEVGSGARSRKKYFPHIVVDFDLSAAMRHGLVKSIALDKRKDVAALPLDFSAERDESGTITGLSHGQRTMIRAGLAKLRILEESFEKTDSTKHPKLLIMTEDTKVSPHVVDFLHECGLGEEDVLRVDSSRKGELGPKEWEPVREKLFDVDRHASPKVIVSVLMLREGFDVNNICVIVPLRSSQSGILLEQTIGRGLRLMWRGDEAIDDLKRETRDRIRERKEPSSFFDVLFIVEHPAFEAFYADLLDDGLAGIVDGDDDHPPTLGDLEVVPLRPDWPDFDFEIPIILRDAEEEMREPTVDPLALARSKYPLKDLISLIGTGDRFASHDMQTGTQFGDYRVDGGVMTATGYNDYLSRITTRITEAIGRTFVKTTNQYNAITKYPILQTHKPLVVGWIDQYIRNALFGEKFDPWEGENWRVLLIGDISEEIAGVFSTALVEAQASLPVNNALVDQRSMAAVESIKVRSSTAVEVSKCIYPKLRVAARAGGLERRFIEWADSDTAVEALIKIDEYAHDFVRRPYLKADGMPAQYSPDFLVRTSSAIYLIETKAQSSLSDENVARKKRAALAWVDQVNEVAPEHRGDREWHYVLLGETAVRSWREKGARASELLAHARLIRTDTAAQPTLL